MKRTYTPLIVGGLVIGGLILWRKAKRERDPFYQAFKGLYGAPTKVEAGKVWIVSMRDGTSEEMTSAELQRAIDTKKGVLSYVNIEQL